MIVKINVRTDAAQRSTLQFVTLDDVRIGLRCHYASFTGRWHLWLVATDGTDIAGPIRLVPGVDLLLQYKHDPRVPPGQLFVHGDPPTKDTVDRESVLLYRPEAQT